MNVQIYLIYICFLFLAYFLSDFAKSRISYILIFVFSLFGLSLSVFFPAEMVTGTITTLVSPTVSTSIYITESLPVINNGLILLFFASVVTSIILWKDFVYSREGNNKF